jgi:hypothetical protein
VNDIAALAGSPLVLKLASVAALVFLCVFYLWRAGSMNTIFERISQADLALLCEADARGPASGFGEEVRT